jgi:hypothetical protein
MKCPFVRTCFHTHIDTRARTHIHVHTRARTISQHICYASLVGTYSSQNECRICSMKCVLLPKCVHVLIHCLTSTTAHCIDHCLSFRICILTFYEYCQIEIMYCKQQHIVLSIYHTIVLESGPVKNDVLKHPLHSWLSLGIAWGRARNISSPNVH